MQPLRQWWQAARTGIPHALRRGLRDERGVLRSTATAVAIVSSTLALRAVGGFDAFELEVNDRLVQLRGDRGSVPDDRLTVIGITDADIQALDRWPLSDGTLARAIDVLQTHEPAAIGIDLYRDVRNEPGFRDLVRAIDAPNVITIRNIDGVPAYRAYGDNPPPDRIGVNDIPLDPDGVVRRALLMADTPDGDFFFSFSLKLATQYFASQPEATVPAAAPENPYWMRFGATTFRPLSQSSALYHNLDNAGQQILLDYRTRSEALAPAYSLSDLLNDRVPDDRLRNRIVLLGTTAQSGRDLFETPYSAQSRDRLRVPGVLIHAQVVSQILDMVNGRRPLPWYWSNWGESLWIAVIGGAAGAVAWRIQRPLFLALAAGGFAIAIGGVALGAALGGGVVPLVAPAIAAAVTGSAIVVHRAYQASQQTKMVMTLLGQSTSTEIAKALWDNRDRLISAGRLPGRKTTATLLFSDIRNFSTISEQLTPEELFEWLNEYLSALSHCVCEHSGIINKFMGDGMMAVFGVPFPRETPENVAEDAYNAVQCALAIAQRLDELNAQWRQRNQREIQMRIGIFTGEAFVGSIGGKERLEYGVIGDSVNTASRLESHRKEIQPTNCRILIGEDTYQAVRDRLTRPVDDWGALLLKGKRRPVKVYRLTETDPIAPHDDPLPPYQRDAADPTDPNNSP